MKSRNLDLKSANRKTKLRKTDTDPDDTDQTPPTPVVNSKKRGNSWARPLFPLAPTVSWVRRVKCDVGPGMWSKPELSSDDARVLSDCLSIIRNTSCTMYHTPRDSVTFIDRELWELPWTEISESRKKEDRICIRVKTSVEWVTKGRVRFNKSTEDSRQWSSRLGAHLNNQFSDEEYYSCFYLLPGKALLVQWLEGYTVVDFKRDAMPPEVHDRTNSVLTQLFRAAAHGEQNRRNAAAANPAPIHAGIHDYRGIPAAQRENYGDSGSAVRFFQDVPSPEMFLQLTPLHAWSNKYYAHSNPEWWQKMDSDNKRKDVTLGGTEKLLNTHHLTWKNTNVHSDSEPWPSLLSYYAGPPEAPWTKGGEVHIPELRLWIVPQPRTVGVIDGRLYHYASEVMGVRHCISSYRSGIGPNTYFAEGLSWINTENFGF